MLDASDIAAMQGVLGLTRTAPCQVLRKTDVSDGMGGQSTSWAAISDPSLTCRVAPVKRQYAEQVADERLQLVTRWAIALPAGQDVDPKDRIVALGITYEVSSVGPRTLELERVAECERVQ